MESHLVVQGADGLKLLLLVPQHNYRSVVLIRFMRNVENLNVHMSETEVQVEREPGCWCTPQSTHKFAVAYYYCFGLSITKCCATAQVCCTLTFSWQTMF